MATVITYGTFDLFHVGHLRLLQRAKALAGENGKLIVAVSTDAFNEQAKGKKTIIPYAERIEILKALRCVDEIIPEETWEQKITDVQTHHVDLFVMGDDWVGKFDFLKPYCDVHYLPRTEGISSTTIRFTAATT